MRLKEDMVSMDAVSTKTYANTKLQSPWKDVAKPFYYPATPHKRTTLRKSITWRSEIFGNLPTVELVIIHMKKGETDPILVPTGHITLVPYFILSPLRKRHFIFTERHFVARHAELDLQGRHSTTSSLEELSTLMNTSNIKLTFWISFFKKYYIHTQNIP